MENKGFKPFVPADKVMTEFSIKALLLGLVMTVILGAANAYLGLARRHDDRGDVSRRGHQHGGAAALQGLDPGRELRANSRLHRRVGGGRRHLHDPGLRDPRSSGTSSTSTFATYLKSTALMMVGGMLGILFVTILRRVMVEDKDLKFPESVAAAEIHKAGQRGGEAATQLFQAMGIGALVQLLGAFKLLQRLERLRAAHRRDRQEHVRLGREDGLLRRSRRAASRRSRRRRVARPTSASDTSSARELAR